MAFTQADLETLQAAILALATGTRPVQMQAGDKMTRYMEMSLADLKAIEGTIQADLATPVLRTYAKQGGRSR
jgi:hypothetical protein